MTIRFDDSWGVRRRGLRPAGRRKPWGPALLQCEAQPSCGMWVKHTFSGIVGEGPKQGHAQYICAGCGHVRIWG